MDGTLTVPKHDFSYLRRMLSIPQEYDILAYIDQLPPHEKIRAEQQLYDWEYDIACQGEANTDALELLKILKKKQLFLQTLKL